jgi:hypothetical protein
MFIVSPSTLCNASALETRSVPKRMIGRISLIPRRGATVGIVARLLFEVQVLRYLAALLPVVVSMFVWPHLALPISQAPIPMLLLIYVVETRVFDMPKSKREALLGEAEADRLLDALRFKGRRLLTRIAARKDLRQGRLHLVIEQSELARVPVLTLISVQAEAPTPQVLDLDKEERRMIAEDLFDDHVTEALLHLVSLRNRTSLHDVTIETGEISAHVRMAARMAAPPEPALSGAAVS